MPAKVYTIHYNLKNREGKVVDSSLGGAPLEFVEGSGQVVKGIEMALKDRSPGQVLDVTVPPELGYGQHRPELVEKIPMTSFEGVDVAPGKVLQTTDNGNIRVVKVLDVESDGVLVDSNHPLAGFTLYFEIQLIAVRDANVREEESVRKLH